MSEELFTSASGLAIVSYCGPERMDRGPRKRYQISRPPVPSIQKMGEYPSEDYRTITLDATEWEALAGAMAVYNSRHFRIGLVHGE